jgi:hypothetical protein
MSDLLRKLGRTLWEMGRAEAVGLSVISLVRADATLSEEERLFIATRMIPEEEQHAAMTRGWAAKYAPPPRLPSDAFGAMLTKDAQTAAAMTGANRLAWVLAVTVWNEVNTVRAYRGWVQVLGRISVDMGRDFQQVLDEERGHVAWGQRVLARLEREQPPMYRRIHAAHQLVRRIYPTVVHGAHAAFYQRLREETEYETRRPGSR